MKENDEEIMLTRGYSNKVLKRLRQGKNPTESMLYISLSFGRVY